MPLYHVHDYPDAAELNPRIRAEFAAAVEATDLRRSHYFNGRFENLYVPLARIPALHAVLRFVERTAEPLLNRPARSLRIGFWFNLMRPGDATTLHTHDDDDELLSAVYYLCVPPESGDLILQPPAGPVRVTPQEGRLVLFAPDLPHAVAENRSSLTRLSVGMNIGPG